MSVQALSTIVADIRIDVDDATDANLSVDEALGGKQDGVNVRFQSSHERVVASTVELRKNGTLLTQVPGPVIGATEFALDYSRGIWTLGAPLADINVRLLATYFWVWFLDDTYHGFIASAGEFVDYPALTAGTNTARATEVIGKVPEGLLPAVKAFSEHLQYRRRAAEWARKYSSSTAGQSTGGADQVTPKFDALAKARLDMANQLRTDYYTGFSKREFPISIQTGTGGVGRYDPRR